VRVEDPVIDGEGLVGKVTRVSSSGALVSLITDGDVEVSAEVSATGTLGMLQPQVGEPERLRMRFLSSTGPVARGDRIVTSGTVARGGQSLYPRGIPIGTVIAEDEHSVYRTVEVAPQGGLRELDTVRVLTANPGSSR
jgi:rod shape-determining protein MreC